MICYFATILRGNKKGKNMYTKIFSQSKEMKMLRDKSLASINHMKENSMYHRNKLDRVQSNQGRREI